MRVCGHLEPLSAVLRIGGAYGEPYTYAVPVRYVTPYEVEILGATRAPTPSEWQGVVDTLKSAGVKVFRFDRRDESSVIEHTVDIGADTPRHFRKERVMEKEKFKSQLLNDIKKASKGGSVLEVAIEQANVNAAAAINGADLELARATQEHGEHVALIKEALAASIAALEAAAK